MSIHSYFNKLTALFSNTQVSNLEGAAITLEEGAEKAVEIILGCPKVMLVGNGGSAAITSHFHNDLVKAVGVRALVFHDVPLLTAYSNDEGYRHVYERPIERWAEAGDLLIAISSSGRSENILRAAQTARSLDCRIITLTGFGIHNPLRQMGELNFYTPSENYGQVEITHLTLVHFFADFAMALVHSRSKNARK